MSDPWASAQPRPFLEQAHTSISPACGSSLTLALYISSVGPPVHLFLRPSPACASFLRQSAIYLVLDPALPITPLLLLYPRPVQALDL